MQRAIQMNIDMMVKACIAVEGFNPETGERQVLQDRGVNILLDNRLAILLEMPNPFGVALSPKQVVENIFGHNGLAIGAHGDKVTEWMRDPKKAKTNGS